MRHALVTVLGLGRLRPAPGTWGSAAAVILCLGVVWSGAPAVAVNMTLCVVAIFFSGVCIALGRWSETHFGQEDPPQVVADETAGQAVALLFLPWQTAPDGSTAWNLALAGGAFAAFRFFDILKPPPIRQVQRAPAGWGILLDDLLAGLAARLLIAALLLGPPTAHLVTTWWTDRDELEELPALIVDDASRMNATRVAEIWDVPAEAQAAQQQLAQLLRRARENGLPVSIAGARHSMGGHTISPDGISINMLPFNRMELDEETDILHVQAGATWSQIIAYLDQRGRSVAVMQSNNSFTVGGSLSVNCHGWQFGRPPIASTVRSFRLMRADGTIVRCSRRENADLFSLVLGGYGLFGIILDVELVVVPNERLRLEQHIVPIDSALAIFDQTIKERPDVSMVYARLNIVPGQLFDDIIINVFRREAQGDIPDLSDPGLISLRRAVFRGSAEGEYGKELRWAAETRLQPYLSKKVFSRNQLLNESVEVFQNRSATSTDILHEYFVPRTRIGEFLNALRRIVPEHDANLLNVTVRSIDTDDDTFLRYADRHMFALVMLFQQPRTVAGDAAMEAMTREMIEVALSLDGRYYLPYRLHATTEQFHRAYPQAKEFFRRKRQYDPDEMFRNRFYDQYMGE